MPLLPTVLRCSGIILNLLIFFTYMHISYIENLLQNKIHQNNYSVSILYNNVYKLVLATKNSLPNPKLWHIPRTTVSQDVQT